MHKLAAGACMAVALMFILSADTPSKAKAHGFALTGTVVSVDSTSKTFTVKGASGRQTALSWTDATRITGGPLKAGERVTLRYLDKDRKHIATSIRVGPPSVATARPVATPAPTSTPAR